MTKLALNTFRLKNFKAVKDSKVIKFTPLTVFIGNNGSGKSSIIEGLETFQSIALNGLDKAMEPWKGIEHIAHKSAIERKGLSLQLKSPICFYLKCHDYRAVMKIIAGLDNISIQHEEFYSKQTKAIRKDSGSAEITYTSSQPPDVLQVDFRIGNSMLGYINRRSISSWQFLTLIPQFMGLPNPQRRAVKGGTLEKDGSNIAEYLFRIKLLDSSAFEGILETLQYVLPYARDLQSSITSELERTVYLQMTEKDFKIPGWLLSTGTLRFLAILALLRHPEPRPIIFIEEIENGLDPRTINILVEEIRNAVESEKTQIIITTHSPYLLDLLHLSQLVLVERDENNQPVFSRPADQEELREWSKTFAPGKLYTMDRIHTTKK
ncbi:MAG: AAA family ATPase [Nitrospirae bacterium]|nr:AAA family ATPase [Nitrospirota bacterium]